MTDSKPPLYQAAPLFEIEIAKFVLPFLVSGGTRIHGLEKTLRGRVGYLLKARFCPFDDFQDPSRDCSRCERSEHCLYPLLFKPWDRASHSKQGNFPPPFFLNLFSRAQDDDWRECEGNLELPLFGPAIVYFRPLLERDLKRAYGQDSLMGEFSQEFYAQAEKVRMDTGALRRISWYAPGSQGKRIPLTGLQG